MPITNSFIALLCSILTFSCYGMNNEGIPITGTLKRTFSELEPTTEPNAKRQKVDTLEKIPDEIWCTIFEDAKPMKHLRGVCLKWCRIISPFLKTISAPNKATDSDLLSINEGFLSPNALRLRGNDKITDTAVMQLTNLTSLDLELGSAGIRIQCLKDLPNFTSLRLETHYYSLKDYTFQPLTRLKSLIWVDNYTHITDKYLQELPQLEFLCLKGASGVSDNVFQELTNLTALGLWENTEIANNALEKLTNLTELALCGNRTITINPLYKLSKLTTLYLSRKSRFTLDELRRLTNLTSLNGDDLNADTLTLDENFNDAALLQFTNLTSLDLGKNLTISSSTIQQLTNLTSLDLRDWLFALSGLLERQLNELRNDLITTDTLSHLPNLTILNGSPLSVDTLALDRWCNDDILLQFSNLTSLDLQDNHKISGQVIRKLTNLTSLSLPQPDYYPKPYVTISDFFCLPNLKTLNGYNLNVDTLALNKRFNDAALLLFTNLTNLDLTDSYGISGTAIPKLTNLTSLTLPQHNSPNLTINDFCCLPNLSILNGYNLNVDTLMLDKRFNDATLLLFTNLTNLYFEGNWASRIYEEKEETWIDWEDTTIKARTIWQLPNLISLNNIGLTTEEISADNLPRRFLDYDDAGDFSLLFMFTNLKTLHLGRSFYCPDILQKLTNVTSLRLGKCGNCGGDRKDEISLLTQLTHLDLGESEDIWAIDVFSLPNLTAVTTNGNTRYLSPTPALSMGLPLIEQQFPYQGQGAMFELPLLSFPFYQGQGMMPGVPMPYPFYQGQGMAPGVPMLSFPFYQGQGMAPGVPILPPFPQGMTPGAPIYQPYQPQ